MTAIRVLIADDHHLFVDGIASLLRDESGILIEDTADDGYKVLELIDRKRYDVCLLDISMPRLDGIEVAKRLVEKQPALRIIILTTYNDREIIEELTKLGVAGYLLKNCTKAELINAIRAVAAGDQYYSPDAQKAMIQNYTSLIRGTPGEIVLTKREIEILKLLADQYTNDRIATALRISYRTVETHRKNMMQKTKAHNLAGLLSYGYSKGLIR